MGSASIAIHPEDGRQIRFRTGHDSEEVYRIGEEVRWTYSRIEPMNGTLLDGVYVGDGPASDRAKQLWEEGSAPWYEEFWVVVKDHKLHAVLPMPPQDREDRTVAMAHYEKLYDIQAPPVDAWTTEQWAHWAQLQAKWEREAFLEDAELYGMNREQRAQWMAGRYVRKKMKETGFFAQIMPPEPVAGSGGPEPTKVIDEC